MTFDEYEAVTTELVKEVQMLSMHWALLKKIDAEISLNPHKFSKGDHFWAMTFNAHLSSVRVILSRIYDTHKSALSLKNWLEMTELTVKKTKYEFEPDSDLNSFIAMDKRSCCVNHNPLVKKFIQQLRNNAIAHSNIKKAISGVNVFQDAELRESDYQTLVTNAQNALNNYIPYIFGYRVSYNSAKEDDLNDILCLL
ncbi:TPA: hypothetical protein I7155_21600 [Vibrio vulnificus]|nr:hypothetical protein [Vibrio vulnificus]HAS6176975.1 hypothetical protein [Vibrio vulnificus]HAS6194780.1 hypothetical protein [Vibrio vulnificus]